MSLANQCIVYDEIVDGYVAKLRADGTVFLGEREDDLYQFILYTNLCTGKPWLPSTREDFVDIIRDGLRSGDYDPDRSKYSCLRTFLAQLLEPHQS